MSQPPGLERPRRFRPRFHYELLACGLDVHLLLGRDAAQLRPEDAVFARQDGALRWLRCLRCDSWLALPAPTHPTREYPPDRDDVELPLRGQALRDKFVLRLIALDRLVHCVILTVLAVAIFLLIRHQIQLRSEFYKVVADLQGGVRAQPPSRHGLVHDLDRLFSLQSGQLHVVGLVVVAYAVLEGHEAFGLWLQNRSA